MHTKSSARTFLVKAQNLTYKYDISGNIIPLLEITPQIQIKDDLVISKFPLLLVAPHTTVAIGDTISIITPLTVNDDCCLRVVEHSDINPRLSIVPDVCPVCGAPVFPSTIGVGKCINRTCRAQLSQNTQILLSALGISVQSSLRKILTALLAKGMLNTPASLFTVDVANLDVAHISPLECQICQQYLYSVRGNVTLSQMLNGLRITGWTPQDTLTMDVYFSEHKQYLPEISYMLDVNTLRNIFPNINFDGWQEFLSIDDNVNFLIELALILGH